MKKRTWFIVLILFLALMGFYSGYRYVYNKPHMDYENASAEHTLSARDLFAHFTDDRFAAEQKFNGRILEITGPFSAVETPDSLTILVFSFREGLFGDEGIRCTLLDHHSPKAMDLDPGAQVTIKGYCTGYNDVDVILEKCSIVDGV